MHCVVSIHTIVDARGKHARLGRQFNVTLLTLYGKASLSFCVSKKKLTSHAIETAQIVNRGIERTLDRLLQQLLAFAFVRLQFGT